MAKSMKDLVENLKEAEVVETIHEIIMSKSRDKNEAQQMIREALDPNTESQFKDLEEKIKDSDIKKIINCTHERLTNFAKDNREIFNTEECDPRNIDPDDIVLP